MLIEQMKPLNKKQQQQQIVIDTGWEKLQSISWQDLTPVRKILDAVTVNFRPRAGDWGEYL